MNYAAYTRIKLNQLLLNITRDLSTINFKENIPKFEPYSKQCRRHGLRSGPVKPDYFEKWSV